MLFTGIVNQCLIQQKFINELVEIVRSVFELEFITSRGKFNYRIYFPPIEILTTILKRNGPIPSLTPISLEIQGIEIMKVDWNENPSQGSGIMIFLVVNNNGKSEPDVIRLGQWGFVNSGKEIVKAGNIPPEYGFNPTHLQRILRLTKEATGKQAGEVVAVG
ncbi:hypothetical protein ACFLZS_01540 [Patescibacteria group bacterium]